MRWIVRPARPPSGRVWCAMKGSCGRTTATMTALLIFMVAISACRPKVCPEAAAATKLFEGNCVGRVEYLAEYRRVNISPKASCSWTNLTDLSIFEGFRPGMTIKSAREQLGEPDEELERDGNRFWRYSRKKGDVQIGHEDQGSTFFTYRWWVLRAYPADRSAEAIFSPDVVSRLPMPEHPYEVVILNQCGLPMLEVIMKGREVQLVTWINNPGSQL